MKPAPVEWFGPRSVDEAVATLAEHGDDAKVLAGGQSLVALMNLRLASPSRLVDITAIDALRGIEVHNGSLAIGAGIRQAEAEDSGLVSSACPLLADALPLVAHREIRNAGTIGGSLAHGDPAAELPAVAIATEMELVLRSARGERRVPAADFFLGYLDTALDADELLVAAHVPRAGARTGVSFVELSPRIGDYGIVGVAASLVLDGDGRIGHAALAYAGVDSVPRRGSSGEAILGGQTPSAELFADAARVAAAALEPHSDVNGSSEYRRHVAEVLTRRALAECSTRALSSDGKTTGSNGKRG